MVERIIEFAFDDKNGYNADAKERVYRTDCNALAAVRGDSAVGMLMDEIPPEEKMRV
jgi:hypothetical protein